MRGASANSLPTPGSWLRKCCCCTPAIKTRRRRCEARRVALCKGGIRPTKQGHQCGPMCALCDIVSSQLEKVRVGRTTWCCQEGCWPWREEAGTAIFYSADMGRRRLQIHFLYHTQLGTTIHQVPSTRWSGALLQEGRSIAGGRLSAWSKARACFCHIVEVPTM